MEEAKRLERAILFETTKEKQDIVYDFKMALINWNKYYNKPNTNQLKQILGVDHIAKIKIKIIDDINESDETLRLYVYKTKKCNVHSIKQKQFSHALQVSLGNSEDRKNWVIAEEGFSAKVFPDTKQNLIKLVEDIVLDMQMFYFYGYEMYYFDVPLRREFSKEKVEYLSKKNVYSYLGDIEDTEYVSFASFCRCEDGKIDFKKYKEMWEDFSLYLKKICKIENDINVQENRFIFLPNTLCLLRKYHPKGQQLSIEKIRRMLEKMPNGRYALVRTERKPKKYKQRIIIENRFGMKKWKSGKIKIVPLKYRFTYQKMIPYVSIFEFEWKE